MTSSPADRQRLKRQRRAEAGMTKVEAWLSADEAAWVRQVAWDNDDSMGGTVSWCVGVVMRDKS